MGGLPRITSISCSAKCVVSCYQNYPSLAFDLGERGQLAYVVIRGYAIILGTSWGAPGFLGYSHILGTFLELFPDFGVSLLLVKSGFFLGMIQILEY